MLEIDLQRFLTEAFAQDGADLALVDRKEFLEFVCNHAFTLTHDVDELGEHPSWWRRLTEALARAAAASGRGVRERQAIEPTCGCNPEEYDGG